MKSMYVLFQRYQRASTQDFDTLGIAKDKDILNAIIENRVKQAKSVHPDDEEFLKMYRNSFFIIQVPYFIKKEEII